jgi:tetratricopeptide (TPR) repeat protein
MRMYRSMLSALLLAGAGACATGTVGLQESVSRLETQQKLEPQSATVRRSLGIAYYKANRYPEARSTLEAAQKLDPKDGTTALYLGLTAEAQNDLPAARTAYASYMAYGKTSRVRGQLEGRLVALAKKELQVEAKAAVAQENTIGAQPSNPRTVAVLPMRFAGPDTNLKALERGFADMLTTDLARSSQLTLVERSRVQALLDEIALQQSGATNAATNVRAGKLVRAGRVVQGSLTQVGDQNLNVTAAVVDVPTSQIRGTANAADQLDAVFNLEKKLALDLFTQLGVTLTVAERNAIEQRPTRSLAAFLAYSKGLVAEDAGQFEDASRFFNEAARIDPGFNAAQQKGQESRQAAAGATVTASTVESGLKGTSEGAVVQAATQGNAAATGSVVSSGGVTSAAQAAAGDINPSTSGVATGAGVTTSSTVPGQKDPVAAGTGTDNPTQALGRVLIVLTRPKTP